jgi:hypothetical protein
VNREANAPTDRTYRIVLPHRFLKVLFGILFIYVVVSLAFALARRDLAHVLSRDLVIRGLTLAGSFALVSELGRHYSVHITPYVVECDLGGITIDRQHDEWTVKEVSKRFLRPAGLEIELPGRHFWTRQNILVPESTAGYAELRSDLLSDQVMQGQSNP